MHLYELPLVFVLVGLIFYVVLAGADFGAGFWQLFSGRGPRAAAVRDLAHESIGPVWEANHVWLIFVLTVTWTAYPSAFGAIASTLSVPLFIAAIGIVLRGGAYAARGASATDAERRPIDTLFALSSILTPFALGTAVGAIASRRVPLGNAAGGLFSSWLTPTSILVGVLAVATSAYLAAVFLAADAERIGERHLVESFRVRALSAGIVAGAIALGGIAVLHADARPLYDGLLRGAPLASLLASILAGTVTLDLVRRRRFELARYGAALAVACVVASWALAQSPLLLPGLSVQQAAAPHDTLIAVVVAVIAGGVILFPSLALLFALVLRGRLDVGDSATRPRPGVGRLVRAAAPGLRGRLAAGCLLAGVGLLSIAEAAWAHALGLGALLGFIGLGFLAAAPARLADQPVDERPSGP